MKKIILILLLACVKQVDAQTTTLKAAKNIATSFYKQHSTKLPQALTLAFTEVSPTGEALYYVFNVNANDGFVIVTADYSAHPIIGYSTENKYVVSTGNTAFENWMKNRKQEIIAIKAAKLKPTEDITREWAGDFSSHANKSAQRVNGLNTVSNVAPLVKTTWDQTPYYNALCPSSSLTGGVALSMAEIMQYWGYPAQGVGSSSYCDCTADGFQNQYGTLTANYGATTYSWSAMPTNVSSANTAVATLLYQCGVSVQTDFDPNSSNAYMLAIDNTNGGISAQTSYTTYFGYDASTIKAYQRTQGGYSDTTWLNFIKTDLAAGRPVQYSGTSTGTPAYSWVCDGYDANNNLHMNWGWAGADNGYYNINSLSTQVGNYSTNHEILTGIQPPAIPITVNSAAICAGATATLTASGASTYTWSPATGLSAITGSVVIASPGITTVYAVEGSNGVSIGVAQATVTIYKPAITITASEATVCAGVSTTLTASGANTYTWNTGTTGAVLVASPTVTSTYTVTAAINTYCSNTNTVSILVAPSPTVNFSLVKDNSAAYTWDAYPNYSSTTDSARWYWGDGTYTAGLYPNHTFSSAGKYSICVTVYSSCGDSAAYCQNDSIYRLANNSPLSTMIYVNVLQVNQTTGINKLATGNTLNLYPNPSNNYITIQSGTELGIITIYNSLGESVFQLSSKNATEQIDISIFAAGIYTIQAQAKFSKLIKE
jgi:hypothetical protein